MERNIHGIKQRKFAFTLPLRSNKRLFSDQALPFEKEMQLKAKANKDLKKVSVLNIEKSKGKKSFAVFQALSIMNIRSREFEAHQATGDPDKVTVNNNLQNCYAIICFFLDEGIA